MVLNIHGECPSGKDITILNAESNFLPTLKVIHDKFPRLKIVLEHCTTKDAVEAVRACGPNVAGTITYVSFPSKSQCFEQDFESDIL